MTTLALLRVLYIGCHLKIKLPELPTSTFIFAQTITFNYKKEVYHDGSYVFGLFDAETNSILISLNGPSGINLTQEQLWATIWHELAHAMMYFLNYDELFSDEQFIDRLGLSLHQTITFMQ